MCQKPQGSAGQVQRQKCTALLAFRMYERCCAHKRSHARDLLAGMFEALPAGMRDQEPQAGKFFTSLPTEVGGSVQSEQRPATCHQSPRAGELISQHVCKLAASLISIGLNRHLGGKVSVLKVAMCTKVECLPRISAQRTSAVKL